ncbi:MAG: arylesterase [Methylocystis sp.]|nr:arylesterase [Methylocystis sp.]
MAMRTQAAVRFSIAATLLLFCFPAVAAEGPRRILVLGDSLSSGYELPKGAGFPYVLARRLGAHGYNDVVVLDGAVAGDSTSGALERLPTALEHGADLVIVEIGGNDMLDGEDIGKTFANLDRIIAISKAVGARVILAGIVALPTRGPAYKAAFNAMYPQLAARHKISLYPFFLKGAFGRPGMMLSDGKHPSVFGVQRIAAGIAPLVERNLKASSNAPSAELRREQGPRAKLRVKLAGA